LAFWLVGKKLEKGENFSAFFPLAKHKEQSEFTSIHNKHEKNAQKLNNPPIKHLHTITTSARD
jgi:hypothetical protein